MTGENLPDDHHIVRYVKPSLVEEETVDGSAFLLRPDEPGLSVNWLEAFGGNDENHQLSEVRRLFRLRLASNGRFAKLNVGATKRHVSEVVEELGIIEAPLAPTDEFEADPSHAEIIGLPPGESDEAMLVGDLIADCVIYPLHPGRTD
jgi:hypothetical protein